MKAERLDEVESLFHLARRRPPEERAAFLDGACRGDLELRAEVESLLAHGTPEATGRPPRPPASRVEDRGPLQEGPGTVIGPYKLLQRLGEGGFGVVYMAEQREPVRRRVALKVIKLGMDTKQVIARFEAERQALALMDHPNIAKVLDAGATQTGRPYFVMELVRGVPITEYCDRAEFTTAQRLRLFAQVCRAIQHAHQKGIVHRDIKPSNILVTLHDGTPVPKVIDFGIAKATNQELTEKTVFTEFRQFIGTPEYMSPEQAEMSGLDVDTRADVYSLGVLLYELLTGTTPVDPARLRSAGYEEIQRILCEEDPERPSTRLSTLGSEAAVVARKRQDDPEHLSRSLRGDLDWILLRALEKDRSRRYETASAFALDVERHLADEPVEASPPSRAYKVRKFVRRHRGAVGAAAALLLVLVLGVVGTTLGFLSAQRALDGEEAARDLAERSALAAREEAAHQRALAGFFESTLMATDPWSFASSAPARVVDLLDLAADRLQRGELSEKPATRAVLARALGEAYLARDRWESALEHFRLAVDTLGTPELDPLTFSRAARELDRVDAESYFELDVDVDVEGLRERALAGLASLVEARDPDVARELFEWSHQDLLRGRNEEAAAKLRTLREQLREVPGSDVVPAVVDFNLACAEARLGDDVAARRLYAESTVGLREIVRTGDSDAASQWLVECEHPAIGLSLETDPPIVELIDLALQRDPVRNLGRAEAMFSSARILYDVGSSDRALELMRDCVEITREFDENELMLGLSLRYLAWLEWEHGASTKVVELAKEARDLLRPTGGGPYRHALQLLAASHVERIVADPTAADVPRRVAEVEEIAGAVAAGLDESDPGHVRRPWWRLCGDVARMHRALAEAGAGARHGELARSWSDRLRDDLVPYLRRPFPRALDFACTSLALALLGLDDATREELEMARELAELADETTGGRLTPPIDALARVLFRLGDVEGAVREGRRALEVSRRSGPVRGLAERIALYEAALRSGD